MVHPQEDRNNVLQQAREPEHQEDPARVAGRAPYPGELVGRPNPPYEVTGLDALSPLLMHVDFPATREEVIAAIGHAVIPVDKATTARVAEVIEKTAPQSFRSSAEVENAVKAIWDQVQPHYEEGRGAHHKQRDNTSQRPVN